MVRGGQAQARQVPCSPSISTQFCRRTNNSWHLEISTVLRAGHSANRQLCNTLSRAHGYGCIETTSRFGVPPGCTALYCTVLSCTVYTSKSESHHESCPPGIAHRSSASVLSYINIARLLSSLFFTSYCLQVVDSLSLLFTVLCVSGHFNGTSQDLVGLRAGAQTQRRRPGKSNNGGVEEVFFAYLRPSSFVTTVDNFFVHLVTSLASANTKLFSSC